jgi:hypothetical protein
MGIQKNKIKIKLIECHFLQLPHKRLSSVPRHLLSSGHRVPIQSPLSSGRGGLATCPQLTFGIAEQPLVTKGVIDHHARY